MVSQKVIIKNTTGLHLRPAELFCKTAVRYKCKVTFQKDKVLSNAKSVLSVLGACVKRGDEIEIFCDGADENEALSAMVEVVESGFGE